MLHKSKSNLILALVAGAALIGGAGAADALSKNGVNRVCWKKVTQALPCDLGNDTTNEGVACQNRARSLYRSCVRYYALRQRMPSFRKGSVRR